MKQGSACWNKTNRSLIAQQPLHSHSLLTPDSTDSWPGLLWPQGKGKTGTGAVCHVLARITTDNAHTQTHEPLSHRTESGWEHLTWENCFVISFNFLQTSYGACRPETLNLVVSQPCCIWSVFQLQVIDQDITTSLQRWWQTRLWQTTNLSQEERTCKIQTAVKTIVQRVGWQNTLSLNLMSTTKKYLNISRCDLCTCNI